MTGRYFDVVFLRFIDHIFVLEHPYDVILTFMFSSSIWSYILTSRWCYFDVQILSMVRWIVSW